MITESLKLHQRLFYFIATGGTAALAHVFIVFRLVNDIQIQPLVANIIAFLIAFNISFLGHKYFTFAKLNDHSLLSLPHFFVVAASAGLINELLYFLLLRFTQLNYLLALCLVLGMVSIYSFVLSRCWACR